MKWPWQRSAPESVAEVELPLTAALIGKLPSRPDFVREGFRGPAADALDAWLVDATTALHGAGGVARLPIAQFCHCPSSASRGGARASIGVLGPSSDSTGRQFPVAIFRELALSGWRARFGDLLSEFRAFLSEAERLLLELPTLTLDATRARLDALPDTGARISEVEPARVGAHEELRAGPLLANLFGNHPPGSQFYALSTFASAFADADDSTQLALECPLREPADAALWLTLAARLSGSVQSCPSFLLSREPARLLMSVATPSLELLRALSAPDYVDDQIWPLTTASLPAIEHARANLQPHLPELASDNTSLSLHELAERLARVTAPSAR